MKIPLPSPMDSLMFLNKNSLCFNNKKPIHFLNRLFIDSIRILDSKLYLLSQKWIPVILRSNKRFFDCSWRSPTQQVQGRTRFVVCSRSSCSSERLHSYNSTSRFVIDVEVTSSILQSFSCFCNCITLPSRHILKFHPLIVTFPPIWHLHKRRW